MSECAIVVLEDFLAIGGVVPPNHRCIYDGLASQYRMVVLSTTEREEAIRFLKVNGVKYDLLRTLDSTMMIDRDWKVVQVIEIMAMGWPVALYLDVDPAVIQRVLGLNVNTLLFSHRVLRPSWLPSDRPPRAWADLTAFIDDQRERAATAKNDSVTETRVNPIRDEAMVEGIRADGKSVFDNDAEP